MVRQHNLPLVPVKLKTCNLVDSLLNYINNSFGIIASGCFNPVLLTFHYTEIYIQSLNV